MITWNRLHWCTSSRDFTQNKNLNQNQNPLHPMSVGSYIMLHTSSKNKSMPTAPDCFQIIVFSSIISKSITKWLSLSFSHARPRHRNEFLLHSALPSLRLQWGWGRGGPMLTLLEAYGCTTPKRNVTNLILMSLFKDHSLLTTLDTEFFSWVAIKLYFKLRSCLYRLLSQNLWFIGKNLLISFFPH